MFKLESYITPLLMGYIDKYVKLRHEDFQLSLWGGDAVLNKLDLRLEAIEDAIKLPIVFKSGHIYELRIHVPWTKLGSEPVIITVNTIECILKLRDSGYEEHSHSSSQSGTAAVAAQPVRRQQEGADDIPPGYLQGLINRVLNNINIIVNNLILKFVDDDIVLSVNVKSAECYSTDALWERSFIELSLPELVLRRVIDFHDLTVCLDRRSANGKIETYQDPLLYRCSLICRIYTAYDNLHAKMPWITKMNILCKKLELSLTDVQVPMFFRLLELCLALYYGTLELPSPQTADDDTKSPGESVIAVPSDLSLEPSIRDEDAGWATWAWSFVPQILPAEEDENGDGGGNASGRTSGKGQDEAVLMVGFYCSKAEVVFKLTQVSQDGGSTCGPRRVTFRPYCAWEADGINCTVLLKGISFFAAQFGISSTRVGCLGRGGSGGSGEGQSGELLRDSYFLRCGSPDIEKPLNYISGSLFDPWGAENKQEQPHFITDEQRHLEVYSERYALERFGTFFFDYLYTMDSPDDRECDVHRTGGSSSRSSVSDQSQDGILQEKSSMKFVLCPVEVTVSSDMVERISKFVHCAIDHDYEPYSKQSSASTSVVELKPDTNSLPPTDSQVAPLEQFVATRTYQLVVLRPVVYVHAASQPPEGSAASREHHSKRKKAKVKGSRVTQVPDTPEQPMHMPTVVVTAERLDIQLTTAMYVHRLVSVVSKMTIPSENLLHHSHSHLHCQLFGLQFGVTLLERPGQWGPVQNALQPCSASCYRKTILLPSFWNNPLQPKTENMCEVPNLTVNLTKPQLMLIMHIAATWCQSSPNALELQTVSLVEDTFHTSGKPDQVTRPVLVLSIGGTNVKHCDTDAVSAVTATMSSLQATFLKRDGGCDVVTPVLSGPIDTTHIHDTSYFEQQTVAPPCEGTDKDCIAVTWQLPKDASSLQAPAAFFLELQGIVGCVDPVLLDWLVYVPTVAKQRVSERKGKVIVVDASLADATSPLKNKEGSQSGSNVTTAPTDSQTPAQTQSKSGPTVLPTEVTADGGVTGVTPGWGKYLADMFPLLKRTELQLTIQSCCVFLPLRHVTLPTEPSMNIAENLRCAYHIGDLPDTLLLCLPRVHASSADAQVYGAGLREIPIHAHAFGHSVGGARLPWSLQLTSCSVYTLHASHTVQFIIKPVSASATVAVTTKYNPPTSDTISSLGLCVHADMQTADLTCSNAQLQLTYDLTMKLVSTVSHVLEGQNVLKRLLAPNAGTLPTDALTAPAAPFRGNTMVSGLPRNMSSSSAVGPVDVQVVTETSESWSRDSMSPCRDTGDSVTLSLWMQWTLLRLTGTLTSHSHNGRGVCLITDIEDLTTAIDVQDIYSKVRCKVGSVNILHRQRAEVEDSSWEPGNLGGVVLSCGKHLSKNVHIISNRLWSAGLTHNAPGDFTCPKEESKKRRDKSHAFLTFTYTRAQQRSVRHRMQKQSVADDNTETAGSNKHGAAAGSGGATYLNEVCLDLHPCDVVLNCPVFMDLLQVFALKSSETNINLAPHNGATVTAKHPLWFVSMLPLIYLNAANFRLFLPTIPCGGCDITSCQDNVDSACPGSSMTASTATITMVPHHDMCVFQVEALSLLPSADNPLPRVVVEKDVYRRALHAGITTQLGSEVEDRQYQLDMRGLSLSTGCWQHFLLPPSAAHSKDTGSTAVVQNPALEWNNLTSASEIEQVSLRPLAASFDLRIVVAPAIVTMQPSLQLLLVCGTSIEMNASSNMDFYISTNQLQLLLDILDSNITTLVRATNQVAAPEKVTYHGAARGQSPHQRSPQNRANPQDMACNDSGVESEASTRIIGAKSTSQVKLPVEASSEPVPTSSFNSLLSLMPIDVLLTARKISLMIYSQVVEDVDLANSLHMWKGSFLEDINIDTSLSSPRAVCHGDSERKDAYDKVKTEACTPVPTVESFSKQAVVRPYIYAYFSQPHSLMSMGETQSKVELSCYDIVLKGTRLGYFFPEESKPLPDMSDFMVDWLETRPGRTDRLTGVPPSLYTLTVTDFLQCANVTLCVERPLKLNLSTTLLRQLRQLQTDLEGRWQTSGEKLAEHNAIPGTNSAPPAPTAPPLIEVGHVSLRSGQLVVAMETNTAPEKACAQVAVQGINSDISAQWDNGEIVEMNVSFTASDLLVKTAYMGKYRPLLGPTTLSLTMGCVWGDHSGPPEWPRTLVFLESGPVEVFIGQELVMCATAIHHHVAIAMEDLRVFKNKSEVHPKVAQDSSHHSEPSAHTHRHPDVVKIQHSSDDLRIGDFEFVVDETGSDVLPHPGEVMFGVDKQYGHSMLSWQFREPRMVTSLDVNPLPFTVTPQLNEWQTIEDLKVKCVLEYWNVVRGWYEYYAQFELSEGENCHLELPSVTPTQHPSVTPCQGWRVVILHPVDREEYGQLFDDLDTTCNIEPVVAPQTLFASLSVSSCFAAHLVPAVQASVSVSALKVRLVNHLQHLGTVTPAKLRPFEMDMAGPTDHEWMVWTVDNTTVSVNWLGDVHTRAHVQAETRLSCDVLEYRTLTLRPLLLPTDIEGDCLWQEQPQKASLKAGIHIDTMQLRVAESTIHSLTTAQQAWTQFQCKNKSKCEKIIPYCYLVCNDTLQVLKFGQVDTDESLVVGSRQVYPYAWRSHKTPQLLRLCLRSGGSHWSGPVCLDRDGTFVVSNEGAEQGATLVVKVQQVTNVQKKVVISGLVVVASRISQHLDVKLVTKPTQRNQKEAAITLGANKTLPSFVVNHSDVHSLKLRLMGAKMPWSQELIVIGDKVKDAKLVKIPLHDKVSFIHVWCHVFTEIHHAVSRSLILITPVFVVRSDLPLPLLMNIETPRLKSHHQVELLGRGNENQLDTMSADMSHNVTFKLGASRQVSTPSLTLASGMIEQVERTSVNEVDIDSMVAQWPPEGASIHQWPYDGAVSSPALSSPRKSASFTLSQSSVVPPDGLEQADIELKIGLSQYWPGCNSLLISVAPYWLMVNETDVDLFVIDGTSGQQWSLPHELTIAPPEFESTFSLGFMKDGQLHVSSAVSLSEEDDSGHYLPRIEGLLYRQGHTPVSIYMRTDTMAVPAMTVASSTTMVCHMVLHSVMRDGLRVVTVREKFQLANSMERDVLVQCHALPVFSHNKISIDCTTSHVTLISGKDQSMGANPLKQELQPLLLWNVPGMSADTSPETLDYAFHLCLALDNTAQADPSGGHLKLSRSTSNQSRDYIDQSKGAMWSCPVWLPVKTAAVRTNVSVQHCGGDGCARETTLCTVMTETEEGVVYIVVAEESSPPLQIHNNCPFPLHFGQGQLTKTGPEAATVYEETLSTPCIPTVPAFSSGRYAFPATNQTFPQIVQPLTQPMLHLAGCQELTDQEPCPLCHHGNSSTVMLWSYGIDVATEHDTFVNLPECSDVKVHIEKVGHTTCIYIDPITRAEISAKEIRSRIKGTNSAASTKVVIIEKKVATNTATSVPKSPVRSERLPEWRTRDPPVRVFSLEVTAVCRHFLLTLSDAITSPHLITDFISLTADDTFVCIHNPEDVYDTTVPPMRRAMYTHWHCSIGDLQLDNQLYDHGSFDFPVILLRQDADTPRSVAGKDLLNFRLQERLDHAKSSAMVAVTLVTCTDAVDGHVDQQSVDVDIQPLVMLFEDTFVYEMLKRIDRFLPVSLSAPHAERCRRGAPQVVRENAVVLVLNPCRLERVRIAPLHVLLSIHASLKLFIACDDTPLSFRAFERDRLFTSQYQLMRTLAVHYATAMLTRAGLIVGSLDILGNPTGLIRNFGTGVADLFRLPYEGVRHGPGAFLSGVTHGMSSLLKHVSTGTLTSITNFASSLSRNMDRLSLDHNYREQQEWLRQRPLGVTDGVRNGLTGFGLSLLGAIAGIADQPLQIIAGGDTDRPSSAMQTATGVVVGVGKGLVGVVTKPIGGAAGLVSQTSLGLLEGTGLSRRLKKRQRAIKQDVGAYPNSRLKYMEKMLQTVTNGDIITSLAADLSQPTRGYDACVLLLTPEVLFIVSVASDDQQRAFPLSEIQCRGSAEDANVLQLLMRQHKLDPCSWEEDQLSNTDRVAHFIDGAASSIAYRHEDKQPPGGASPSTAHQGERSPVASIQYEFYVEPSEKQLFLSLFAIAQNKLIGFAFAL